tara:strand:+ start:1094 stop:2164 length:1071 start_codon:yes stop_codon:yes gene_type:complete
MKKVLLHGAYRGDNFGDTLLLLLIIKALEESCVEVILSNVCDKTYEYCRSFKKVRRLKNILDIHQSDALIYGGGGYFGEQPLNKGRWHLSFIKNHLLVGLYCRIFNKPIGMFGVEFGPLTNPFSLFLSKVILSRSTIICPRNKASFLWLKANSISNNVVQTVDMALGVNKYLPARNPENSSKKEILLHPSFTANETDESLGLMNLIKAMDLNKHGFELSLISDRDNQASSRILESWGNALGEKVQKKYIYNNPWELCSIIQNANCIITNKLHAAIVAASFGNRVISLAKHPKNMRFFQDINRDDLCILLEDIDLSKLSKLLNSLENDTLESITLSEDIIECIKLNNHLLEDFVLKL